MDNKDIISILFDKIEYDGLFDFDNSEKDELDSEVTVLSKRISKYKNSWHYMLPSIFIFFFFFILF